MSIKKIIIIRIWKHDFPEAFIFNAFSFFKSLTKAYTLIQCDTDQYFAQPEFLQLQVLRETRMFQYLTPSGSAVIHGCKRIGPGNRMFLSSELIFYRT